MSEVLTSSENPPCIEGKLIANASTRVAIVASRFNNFIVDRLVDGAVDALRRHGCQPQNIVVVRVPGAWEIPPVVRRLVGTGKFRGVVSVGAVVRGSTPHFDYVASEVSKGLAQIALANPAIPVGFGILTTDNIEQAVDRAGMKAGNKGFEAAMGVIEMIALTDALDMSGY